jgi:predicted enzyme related to lactoylglutathione lyase
MERQGHDDPADATDGQALVPWGHRVAHITDPDGNSVNLTQQL